MRYLGPVDHVCTRQRIERPLNDPRIIGCNKDELIFSLVIPSPPTTTIIIVHVNASSRLGQSPCEVEVVAHKRLRVHPVPCVSHRQITVIVLEKRYSAILRIIDVAAAVVSDFHF